MTQSALPPANISAQRDAGAAAPRSMFWLFRIIGNALPPRHAADHHVRTAEYILDHEPHFADCRKTWILNQIVDPAEAQELAEMLRARGEHVVEIPFDSRAAARAHLDASGLPDEVFHPPRPLDQLTAVWRLEWLLRHKSLALANVNRARNVALRMGRPLTRWTLPLDGGVMFTRAGWEGMCGAVTADPQAKFAGIGFVRVNEFDEVEPAACPDPRAFEPQIAFRDDTTDEFDETLRYGHRNKVELLGRIGASGSWLRNSNAPWDRLPSRTSPDHGAICWGGFVVRLPTGASAAVERDNPARWRARFDGIARLAAAVDVARGRAAVAASGRWTAYADPRQFDAAARAHVEALAAEIVRKNATAPLADSGADEVSRLAREGAVLDVAGTLSRHGDPFIDALHAWVSRLLAAPSTRVHPQQVWERLPLRDLWLLPQTLDALAAGDAATAKAAADWCGGAVDAFVNMRGAQRLLAGGVSPTATSLWTKAIFATLSLAAGRTDAATFVVREVPIDLVALARASGAAGPGIAPREWLDIAAACAALVVIGRRVGVDLRDYRGRSGEGIGAVWSQVNSLPVDTDQRASAVGRGWIAAVEPVLAGSPAGGGMEFVMANPLGIPPLWPALAPRGL